MTAVLHIGLPKTGTTYLQEWLKLNKDRLRQNGLAVLSSAASHRLAAASLRNPAFTSRPDIMAIIRDCQMPEAVEELNGCRGESTVISSEYFFHCNPTDVKNTMDRVGVSVTKIICFLRRQDRLCASGYAQEVKSLGLAKRVADYGAVSYEPLLDWNHLHEEWTKAFPLADLVFQNFDSCGRNGSLVETFQASIGASEIGTDYPSERVNESLSAHLTELTRMMNEKRLTFDLNRLMEVHKKTKLAPFSFNKAITKAFEIIYLPSNQLLAKRYPQKFDDFGTDGWQPNGIDMTDKLDAEQQADILFRYVSVD